MSVISAIAVGLGAIGGIAGIVALLNFFNTFRSVNKKTSAEAESAVDDLQIRRLKNAQNSIRYLERRDVLRQEQNDSLMALVRDILLYVSDNIPHRNDSEIIDFQNRLTKIRRMTVVPEESAEDQHA